VLSIRDYVRLAAPERNVLKIIERRIAAKANRQAHFKAMTNVIQAARAQKAKRG